MEKKLGALDGEEDEVKVVKVVSDDCQAVPSELKWAMRESSPNMLCLWKKP